MRFKMTLVICLQFLSSPASCEDFHATARFLAGMPSPRASPYKKAETTTAWKGHARSLSAAWKPFERSQLRRIRAFVLNEGFHERTVFYAFSGPDLIYAKSFFPNARTYILTGLEPIGLIPTISDVGSSTSSEYLGRIRGSLSGLFKNGFFVTRDMMGQDFPGIAPILLVLLARLGDQVQEVRLVSLSTDGLLSSVSGTSTGTQGLEIRFLDTNDGNVKEVIYFNVDLSNRTIDTNGFIKFCEKLERGVSILKNASYLLHQQRFSVIRAFLLERSISIVQDDSGIPFRYFDQSEWTFRFFGQYRPPLGDFKHFRQADLEERLLTYRPKTVDFGFGYFWWLGGSHLEIATRKTNN